MLLVQRLILLLASTTTLTVAMTGCGSGHVTYPVLVKVSFPDGKTLEGAIVAFHSMSTESEAVSAIGKVGADGTCELTTFTEGDGAVAGRHRVTVAPPPSERSSAGYDRTKQNRPPIHPRFLNPNTSGLEVDVSADGQNEFTIQIERP